MASRSVGPAPTEWPSGGIERYDHHSDPLEYINLSGDPAHRDRESAMKALLKGGWKSGLPTG